MSVVRTVLADAASASVRRADLQRAYAQLERGSIERRVVWERMTQPAALDTLARRIGARASIVRESYRVACVRMSLTLGYAPGASTSCTARVLVGTST